MKNDLTTRQLVEWEARGGRFVTRFVMMMNNNLSHFASPFVSLYHFFLSKI